jgi:Dipeptidyl aminopeptidases/acylaminoacyl-peptidases
MLIRNLGNTDENLYNCKDQLKQFVYNRSEEAFSIGNSSRDMINSINELEKRRKMVRCRFMEALGGLPSTDVPLNPKVTGIVNGDGFTIEKVIFEPRVNTYVTANLYIPDGITSPCPAVLFLCGHSDKAKQYAVYQAVCQYLVRAGLIVLIQDPVGQGERFSYYESELKKSGIFTLEDNDYTTVDWGCREHDYAGRQCLPLGDSLARYFVHDAIRGIDYLCTRPEVDRQRIGITGSSGGGTQTSMMMICDTRIAAAAPATFIMNRQTMMHTGQSQDAEQIWPGMTTLGFDHEDILMMMAPKPVLILAAKYDYFPVEGTRSAFERAKRFWGMYGKCENIELFEDDTIHSYTRKMARKAAEFFALHLFGREITITNEAVKPLEPSVLWCTKSGQIREEIEGSYTINDENNARITELRLYRRSLAPDLLKERALGWLRDRVFFNRRICNLNFRHVWVRMAEEFIVRKSLWWSQQGVYNHSIMFTDFRFAGRILPATIAVWSGGTCDIQTHINWIRRETGSGRTVIVLDVTGVGALSPNPINDQDILNFDGTIFKLADDLIWLNDSLAAIRTYDVTRALDAVEAWKDVKSGDIRLYAHGRYGLYTQLAAVLDKRVRHVDLVDGIDSYESLVGGRHYDCYDIMSVVFPGILKYFDLPDLQKWTDIPILLH